MWEPYLEEYLLLGRDPLATDISDPGVPRILKYNKRYPEDSEVDEPAGGLRYDNVESELYEFCEYHGSMILEKSHRRNDVSVDKQNDPTESRVVWSLDDMIFTVLVLLEKLWILEIDEDGVLLDVSFLEHLLDDLLLCERAVLFENLLDDVFDYT